jgi:hypothetical protein
MDDYLNYFSKKPSNGLNSGWGDGCGMGGFVFGNFTGDGWGDGEEGSGQGTGYSFEGDGYSKYSYEFKDYIRLINNG